MVQKTKIDELVDILKDIYDSFTPNMYKSSIMPIILHIQDVLKVKDTIFSVIINNNNEKNMLSTGDIFFDNDTSVANKLINHIKEEHYNEFKNKIINNVKYRILFIILFDLIYIYNDFFENTQQYTLPKEEKTYLSTHPNATIKILNENITFQFFIDNYNEIFVSIELLNNEFNNDYTNFIRSQNYQSMVINNIQKIRSYIRKIKEQQHNELITPKEILSSEGTSLAGGSHNLRHSIDLIIQSFKKQRPSLNINPDLLYNCILSSSKKNKNKPLRKYNQRTKR